LRRIPIEDSQQPSLLAKQIREMLQIPLIDSLAGPAQRTKLDSDVLDGACLRKRVLDRFINQRELLLDHRGSLGRPFGPPSGSLAAAPVRVDKSGRVVAHIKIWIER
jgi:hypothetical protein